VGEVLARRNAIDRRTVPGCRLLHEVHHQRGLGQGGGIAPSAVEAGGTGIDDPRGGILPGLHAARPFVKSKEEEELFVFYTIFWGWGRGSYCEGIMKKCGQEWEKDRELFLLLFYFFGKRKEIRKAFFIIMERSGSLSGEAAAHEASLVSELLKKTEEVIAENLALRSAITGLTVEVSKERQRADTVEKQRHDLQLSLMKLTVKAADMDMRLRKVQLEKNALVMQLMKYGSQEMKSST